MTKKKTRKQSKQLAPRSIRRIFPQVKYVKDADNAVEVHVKKTDCNSATQLDPMECALAKAAKREYHADAAVIGLASSYIIKGDTAIRYDTGQRIAREIVSFDRHADFAPGVYTLVPKTATKRFGASKQKNNSNGGENKTAKRKIHRTAKVRDLTTIYSTEQEVE